MQKHLKLAQKDIWKGRHGYTIHNLAQEKQAHLSIKWLRRWKETRKAGNVWKAAHKFSLKYHILQSWYIWTHKPLKEAQTSQQALTLLQENVVKDWICYLGAMGLPLNISELHHMVGVIIEKPLLKRYIYHFLDCHPNLTFCHAASLNPKHGSPFNETTVKDCFNKISNLFTDPNTYAKFFQVPGPDVNPQ